MNPEVAAELVTLGSILAFALPAWRITRIQAHQTRLGNIATNAQQHGDKITEAFANEIAAARAKKADRFYWLDKLFLSAGFVLAVVASLIKLDHVLHLLN
ncbi:hypothetical protein [Paraburkholderia sp.]|uniref:hypothetical protein n=1 Tax=Paraburkholderia sp. TaxID=1926495 RepID=UPI002B498191|nr:hypothetical protein [Paraburkholderia sp.]